MSVSPLAGSRPDASLLVDVDALLRAYHSEPAAPVAFGTSGHRGSSLKGTFTEAHVLAISEAIARHREVDGPLFVARDTHALSEPAFHTAVSVFSAHGIDVRVDAENGYTPTTQLRVDLSYAHIFSPAGPTNSSLAATSSTTTRSQRRSASIHGPSVSGLTWK